VYPGKGPDVTRQGVAAGGPTVEGSSTEAGAAPATPGNSSARKRRAAVVCRNANGRVSCRLAVIAVEQSTEALTMNDSAVPGWLRLDQGPIKPLVRTFFVRM